MISSIIDCKKKTDQKHIIRDASIKQKLLKHKYQRYENGTHFDTHPFTLSLMMPIFSKEVETWTQKSIASPISGLL